MKQVAELTDINTIDIVGADLNLIRVFEALLHEQGASAAAVRLGVSQAAVSASLRRLRQLYGDPLFERTQTGLRPTARALVLKPLIEDAMQAIRRSLAGRQAIPAEEAPQIVTLGLSDDYEMALGRGLVAALRQAAPAVRLVFRQTHSGRVAAALIGREIDLAITAGGAGDARLRHLTLGHSGYLCVFDRTRRPDSLPLTLEEYVARDHLLVSFSGLTGIVDDVLAEHGLRRRFAAATSHFAALPFLLEGTDCLATLPAHAARALTAAGPFAAVACPIRFPAYAVNLGWRADLPRQPLLRQVRDLLAEAATAILG
jgi:DNA-binding transcriptional LysR family regulator